MAKSQDKDKSLSPSESVIEIKKDTQVNKQDLPDNKEPSKQFYKMPNYYKFDEKESVLRECLSRDMTYKEISDASGLCLVTVPKYVHILSIKDNHIYSTKDEKAYLSNKTNK